MSQAGTVRGPLPRWYRFADLLPRQDHRALLDWTLEAEARFKPARVTAGVVPETRIAGTLYDLGPLRPVLEARLRAMLPDIFQASGVRPFEVEHIELEMVAHGDGAFYVRHTDIPFGPGRKPLGGDASGRQDRLLSGVFYYHREPKAFSGGALRLHRFGGGDGPEDHVDIEPLQNSLVVFPSWAEHEVRRVACPSGAFEDSRFAINAWFCRTLS